MSIPRSSGQVLIADISKYQMFNYSAGKIDFAKMRAGDICGVIFRACRTDGSGITYKDIRLDEYVRWLREYNWSSDPDAQLPLIGFYAYVRLERDIQQQADFLLKTIEDHVTGAHRLIIDIEGDRPWGLSPSLAGDRLHEWIDHVGADMIYTRAEWFDSFIAAGDWEDICELWISRWPGLLDWKTPVIPGPWSDGKYTARDWSSWRLWQYGTPAVGRILGCESEEIDLSIFNGDQADFSAWLGKSVAPPEPVEQYVTVTASNYLNIRSGPGTQHADKGDLKSGLRFRVLERVGEWVRIGENAWIATGPGLAIVE